LVNSDVPIIQSAGSTGGFLSAVRGRFKGIGYSRLMPVLIIALILLLALFLRSYYSYGVASENGWLMSGGSDSFYYHRLIEQAATTGEHLHFDPMLNFPDGARNPRPPLYTFSVAVPAVVFQPMFGDLTDSIGFFFITSTALFGALTIIPVYLIAKEIFGRRSGYLAALFLAIMPSSVERSVATLCDHDAFALFFIVLTVYFLMKSLKAADTSKWVEKWTSPKSIGSGMKMLFGHNRNSMLYALLAGLSFSAIAMAWVGFTYIEVILLASFIVEILINKFKGVDSTTHTMLYLVMFGVGFLVAFPVYNGMGLENMNVPVYLFLAAFVVGALFTITRDSPWLFVMPILAVVLGLALA
jgi:dolichyl-phosphooligosaccharide-protein glycotransferase